MNWNGAPPLIYSVHARKQMCKRQIADADVESIVRNPSITHPCHDGRTCVDATLPTGRRLRVVLAVETTAIIVVSTYYLP